MQSIRGGEKFGRLVQLAAHMHYKHEVVGSNPTSPIGVEMFNKDILQRLCEHTITLDTVSLVLRRSPDWHYLGVDGLWHDSASTIPARIFSTMRDLKHEGRKQLQLDIHTAPFQRTDAGDKCLLNGELINYNRDTNGERYMD